ncbi:WD repeat-containing protein 18-like protein [Leptotrombidium deliense]|uniref:WD repeat-containing protein 18-like protein n=1 Tax=Leptotrombidium deliense TaxID=299467 RepID=A0A443SDA9_9ACAR|nr:WD repeat-containing protein 18-like protein [Leptotrombidium deliense]
MFLLSKIIFCGDINGQTCSVSATDLMTGTTVRNFKGAGGLAANSLSLISDQYLIGAQKDSPVLYCWSLRGKDQQQKKIICAGKINALCATPDGHFVIVAVKEELFVYQLSSGCLLTKLERHFQPVTCIRTSSDSSYFISGGEDGIVLVWFLHELLNFTSLGLLSSEGMTNKEPKHSWSHHTAQITDICCSYSRINGKCVTCSTDQTCKVYEVLSGTLLVSLVFDTPLWSVAMDPAQYFLFIGGDNGNIYETRLYEKPSQIISRNAEQGPEFIGHSAKVNRLCVSVDGFALVSGSYDSTVKVWHVISKQCMRTVTGKGPINNLLVALTPRGLISDEYSLKPIEAFKREVDSDSSNERGSIAITITNTTKREHLDYDTSMESTLKTFLSKDEDYIDSTEEVKRLKSINENMYNYAVDAIFKSLTH